MVVYYVSLWFTDCLERIVSELITNLNVWNLIWFKSRISCSVCCSTSVALNSKLLFLVAQLELWAPSLLGKVLLMWPLSHSTGNHIWTSAMVSVRCVLDPYGEHMDLCDQSCSCSSVHLPVFCLSILIAAAGIHSYKISRVPDHNGVSQEWYIVEIHHSGQKLSIWRSRSLKCMWRFHAHTVRMHAHIDIVILSSKGVWGCSTGNCAANKLLLCQMGWSFHPQAVEASGRHCWKAENRAKPYQFEYRVSL